MGPSWQQLLIVLIIVALIFGTKKLRSIGSDLGGAVKGFKKSVSDNDDKQLEEPEDQNTDANKKTAEQTEEKQ